MTKKIYHDPAVELNEIRNQLAYQKRVGFFFGAGTSKAIGISDLAGLTIKVKEELEGGFKTIFDQVVETIKTQKGLSDASKVNVEDILNHIRLVRKITHEKTDKSYESLSGDNAKKLDEKICGAIYKIITEEEGEVNLESPKKFIAWLNWFNTEFTKEIFTTNYDLVFEKCLEQQQIPYFDGFVGSYEPFFIQDSLDSQLASELPPKSWIRLWKVHGSIGWFWKMKKSGDGKRVVRRGVDSIEELKDQELVIYPSTDKYESSRRQPYVVYLDRLKKFLSSGEGVFVISGYSFSDQHLNEIIFNGLRQNSRLHAICFSFKDEEVASIFKLSSSILNFSIIGPKTGVVRGEHGEWKKEKESELLSVFYTKNEINLGDFNELVRFLLLTSGSKEKIEKEILE